MLLVPELGSAAAPWAIWAARCWQSPSTFLLSSSAFFASLVAEITNGALSWLPTQDACADCAVLLFGPTGGTKLGILDNYGPPGETGLDTLTDS